jgi:hypothetical protein
VPDEINPYTAPQSELAQAHLTADAGRVAGEPGRGVLILILGILSIVACTPLGPVAWAMGVVDLRQISTGRISPQARGLTQAGMICGIVGSVFLALGVLWFIVALFLAELGLIGP